MLCDERMMSATPDTSVETVESWLDRLYVAAEGASLRQDDRRKAREVAAMLDEIERLVRRLSRRLPLVLVDAAAGKSYVGLLAARLILEPLGRPATVVTIERDAQRVASSRIAAERLESAIRIECRLGDVRGPGEWPERPAVVTALHACGVCGRDHRAHDRKPCAHVAAGSVLYERRCEADQDGGGTGAPARHPATRAGQATFHPVPR